MKMKSYILSLFFVTMAFFAQAQNTTENTTKVEVNTPVDFYITQAMTSYPQINPMDIPAKEHPRGGMLSGKRQMKADFIYASGES